jgi:hypothetical protein
MAEKRVAHDPLTTPDAAWAIVWSYGALLLLDLPLAIQQREVLDAKPPA